MDLKEIKAIIELMSKNNLSEFDLEREGFKIRIKKGSDPLTPHPHSSLPPIPLTPLPSPVATLSPPTPTPPQPTTEHPHDFHTITTPMVGTFYRAPSPDSEPYVQLGQRVTPDTVVCIIEAMKVMNEIKAETSGTIVEILAENGKAVEYGQALFKIRRDS